MNLKPVIAEKFVADFGGFCGRKDKTPLKIKRF
jgi:hypothetical protein